MDTFFLSFLLSLSLSLFLFIKGAGWLGHVEEGGRGFVICFLSQPSLFGCYTNLVAHRSLTLAGQGLMAMIDSGASQCSITECFMRLYVHFIVHESE